MSDPDSVPQCMNCGLPQTRNPHPLAGKPAYVNTFGAQWGCLPCAELRANSRADVFCEIQRLLQVYINNKWKLRLVDVLASMASMEERRIQRNRRACQLAKAGEQDLPAAPELT